MSSQNGALELLLAPARIEALIERVIRTAVAATTTQVPLYPKLPVCPPSSVERLMTFFANCGRLGF